VRCAVGDRREQQCKQRPRVARCAGA
jgi:hypothetical protein